MNQSPSASEGPVAPALNAPRWRFYEAGPVKGEAVDGLKLLSGFPRAVQDRPSVGPFNNTTTADSRGRAWAHPLTAPLRATRVSQLASQPVGVSIDHNLIPSRSTLTNPPVLSGGERSSSVSQSRNGYAATLSVTTTGGR